MIYGDSLRGYWEKSVLKMGMSHLTRKIRIAQDCAAMSAKAEFLFSKSNISEIKVHISYRIQLVNE